VKHFMLLSLFVFIAISSVGCQSKGPIPESKMFSLNVTVPKDVQEDKPFKVESALFNNSNSSWEIKHGAAMITYAIYDGNGELVSQGVDQIMVNAIGMVKVLKAKEAYIYDAEGQVQPKLNEFTLSAGSYKIVSKATFNIKHAGKDIEFDITSTPVEIKLAPR
jgi:hypothetical protein